MVHRAVFTLLLLVASAARLAAADDPPKTQPAPSGVIPINLNAAQQTGRLPFDVPVVLQLTLDSDVTSVGVFRSLPSKVARCDSELPFTRINTWRRFGLGRAPATTDVVLDNTNAYVTVDPIDANRHVCFKFEVTRRLSPKELQAFTADAVKTADKVLRVPSSAIDTRDINAEMHTALRVVLGIVAPVSERDVRRQVAPGSMLDVTPTDDAWTAFGSFMRDVLEPAFQRETATQSLIDDGQVVRAGEATAAFLLNPFLTTYDTALTAAASRDAFVGRVYEPVKAALGRLQALVDPNRGVFGTTERAKAAASGVDPAERSPASFDQIWDAGGVTPRLTIAQSLRSDLLVVSQFLRSPLPAGVTLPDAPLNELRKQADTALSGVSAAVGSMLRLQDALRKRIDAVQLFASRIGDLVAADAFVGTSSFADFNTRSPWYLSVDAGLATAPRLDATFPYVGGNIYFRPVNKDAPLSLRGGWKRRVSLMVGASYYTDLTKPGEIAGSLGNRMLMMGTGLRITDMLRAGVGLLLVKALDPNPLVTRGPRFESTPFFSLSIDWDAKGTFTKAFTDTNK